jgi:hypothetical protein
MLGPLLGALMGFLPFAGIMMVTFREPISPFYAYYSFRSDIPQAQEKIHVPVDMKLGFTAMRCEQDVDGVFAQW